MSAPRPPGMPGQQEALQKDAPQNRACGLVVAGVQPRCGKTVACAGLAGALTQLGFRIQAMKPLVFTSGKTPDQAAHPEREMDFFNRVSPPLERVETVRAATPRRVSGLDWQRVLDVCRRRAFPYLLEAPGMPASPLCHTPGGSMDTVDLARALQGVLLLVAPKHPEIIAMIAPTLSYLREKNAACLGWIAVETVPAETPDWEADTLYLAQRHQTSYLGEITYSPSISVESCRQGNLIRLTETGVDLLPVQRALRLPVPEGANARQI